MEIDPRVSIFAPSIYPEKWMRMYNTLTQNDTSFELVFVGNVIPAFDLPDNIRFIFSPVKPPQCAEIGLRSCIGEYCMFAPDDLVFNPNVLDNLIKAFESTNRQDICVSCTPYLYGKELRDSYYRFFPVDDANIPGHKRTSPITPIGGLYKTKVVRGLGGIDRNFIKSAWDVDVVMQLYSAGGMSFFCKEAIAEEVLGTPEVTRLCSGATHDREYLCALWTMPIDKYLTDPSAYDVMYVDENHPIGAVLRNRTKPVERFQDEDILTKSQGSKGDWV